MATPVVAFAQLATECEAEGLSPQNAERMAQELAKVFSVHLDEVAILQLQRSNLHFSYPTKLHNVGSIPINNSTSVAARTASTKRAEAVNNFAQIKHASVFESVDLNPPKQHTIGGPKEDKQAHIIQKLMSVPVMGPAGVLGVIQICRKGKSAPEAGADFGPPDIQKLVQLANVLAKCFK
jgi:hypothetical protein